MRPLEGSWNKGFALDKHTLSSVYLGDNEYGHPQFDTTRSDVGEALYQLKYRGDWSKVSYIAERIVSDIVPRFSGFDFIVPMPPTEVRPRQPVQAIAEAVGRITGKPVFLDVLRKAAGGPSLKDISGKDEKIKALAGRFSINDEIKNMGRWNVFLIDDLYDSGASMECACRALMSYQKVKDVFVAAVTWK